MTISAININNILTGVVLLVSMVFASICYSQSKADYTWIWAGDRDIAPGRDGILLEFTSGKRTLEEASIPYLVGQNNTVISDESGNLLFYSNGCQVINKEHELMVNGDSINYGQFWVDFTLDCLLGYTGTQNSIILPDPGNENGYYLIHKSLEYYMGPNDNQLYIPDLKYSYIDLNNELGEVTVKNEVFYDTDSIVGSYLTAILHENGHDWWFIQLGDFENAYYKFLLSETGIAVIDTQYLGPVFNEYTSASGQAKFSPMENYGRCITIIKDCCCMTLIEPMEILII